MKKLILQLLSTAMMLGMCLTTFAQQSYLTADGVAVFIPKDYDAAQHLPSPARAGAHGHSSRYVATTPAVQHREEPVCASVPSL